MEKTIDKLELKKLHSFKKYILEMSQADISLFPTNIDGVVFKYSNHFKERIGSERGNFVPADFFNRMLNKIRKALNTITSETKKTLLFIGKKLRPGRNDKDPGIVAEWDPKSKQLSLITFLPPGQNKVDNTPSTKPINIVVEGIEMELEVIYLD